jgi:MFS family permease
MSLDLIFLSISLFIWGIGEGMFYYFQPIYLKELGADPIHTGAILGCAGLAMAAAHIPAGYLSDRFGRLPVMRSAWLVGLISAWMMALAEGLNLFVAGLLLYGFTAFVASPLNSYVTAARGKWSVSQALTFASAMFNLGAVIGPVSGGWLAEHFGLRTIYFLSGSLFVVSTLLVFLLRSQPVENQDPHNLPANLFSNTRYITFLGVVFIVMFALYLPQPLTSVFLADVRGISLANIGWFGTMAMLGSSLLSLLLGQFKSSRVGFLLSQVSVGLFTLLVWRGAGLPFYFLAYFLLGGYRAGRTLVSAQIRPLVHEAQMGLAYGMAETVNNIPSILAPPLAGFLYDQNPASIFPFSLAAIGLALIVTLSLAPRPRNKAILAHE